MMMFHRGRGFPAMQLIKLILENEDLGLRALEGIAGLAQLLYEFHEV